MTPNVSGQIVAIPGKPNVPAKTGEVLFQIDPDPFQFKVKQCKRREAATISRRSKARIRG